MGGQQQNPELSVIIPVYNAEKTLGHTLNAIFSSTYKDCEVILVDDASTDRSIELARDYECRVLRQDVNAGPSAARNRGARAARGDILFFTDSDVTVLPNTLAKIVDALENHPDFSAVIGSYTIDTPCRDFFSTFKNLVHHYTHQHSLERAITFWAGCGAIRRSVFLAVEGFDERYKYASIEDIELGYRLTRAGYNILLAKEIQVTHNKKYDFTGLVKSDVFNRAVPWTTLMMKEGNLRSDLNTTRSNAIGLVSTYLCTASLLGGLFYPVLFLPACGFFIVFLFCNRSFYAYAYRFKGLGFTLQTVGMNFIFYLYSGVGLALGVANYLWSAEG